MRYYLSIPPEGEATLSTVQPKVFSTDVLFEIEVDVGTDSVEMAAAVERKMPREKALALVQATIRGKGDFSMGVRTTPP